MRVNGLKIMKKSKKKVKKVVKKKVKKSKSKKTSPNRVAQEVRIVVQSSPMVVPTEKDIVEPIHEGKKYAITPTWVSTNQIMRMVQRTPKEAVYVRPGKGGQKWSYVTGNYVEKVLNYVFGFMWDFEVVSHGQQEDFIWVQGKLTVKNSKGQTITKTQFGRKEVAYLKDRPHKPENMLDYGNDLKSATTDSLKKCASMLGIASDIYGKTEYKQETGREVRETTNLPPPSQNEHNQAPELKKGQVIGPDGYPTWVCKICGDPVSEQEKEYSEKIYKGVLCREHQEMAKKK